VEAAGVGQSWIQDRPLARRLAVIRYGGRMIWTLVIAGYLAPALIAGLALRPAGDVMRRWGTSAGCAC
jgi:hypothetical protein